MSIKQLGGCFACLTVLTLLWIGGCPCATNPPRVLSSSPAHGTTGVSTTATISITFDRSAAPDSLDGHIEPEVGFTYTWSQDNTVVTVQPTSTLAANTLYTVTVTACSFTDGCSLPAPSSFSFTTGGGAVPGWPPQVSPGLEVMVAMPDGTRLTTDIYAPSGNGPWPVVLLRTPYDSKEANRAAEHADRAATLNAAGIVYVRQNSRGLYGSEGTADLFASDRQDGRDMITLVAAQSWCNGRIAMMGQSAPGIEAYMALPNTTGAATDLVCAWVEDATPDLYKTVYQGGVFRKALVEDWLQATTQDFLLPDVVANATDATWWAPRRVVQDFDEIAAPTMHVSGWFDLFTNEQIDGFVAALQAGVSSQYLIVGPWTHLGLDQQQQGELTFPANAANVAYPLSEEFLLWFLLDQGDISGWPTVRYYVMGDVDDASAPGNEWRTANQWPPFTPNLQTYYLRSAGALSQTAPPAGEAPDQYTYDPQDPVPTVGGHNMNIAAGPHDQTTIEARADVLTYTTAPLASALEVTGKVQAKIYLQCSQPDTDLMVRLCDVYPDGRSMAITEGVLRLRFRDPTGPPEGTLMTAGQTYEIDLDLWPTSIVFNTGHRVRIAVASSSDPRFDPNPNTGDAFRANTNTVPATITVRHDQTYPSAITLPTP